MNKATKQYYNGILQSIEDEGLYKNERADALVAHAMPIDLHALRALRDSPLRGFQATPVSRAPKQVAGIPLIPSSISTNH